MALILCKECGKEISDRAEKCPNCGFPISEQMQPVNVSVEKKGGFWTRGRLAIGIISIVLFFLITFQSCAVGLSNTLSENGAATGSSGFFMAFFMLMAGIVGISTRNSKSKIGALISTVLYWIGALLTVGSGDTYGDLPIWGSLAFVFGIVFLICAIKTKKTS